MNATPGFSPLSFLQRVPIRRSLLFGVLILTALLAFEMFNYSTTDFALTDLLGNLRFAGISWATILAIAFCGIDFAGIARLFTPQQGADEPAEVWYLFGAWILAATMNAMLTWWGVSIAILNHSTLGNAVVDHGTLLKVVPIFVAVMVWLIRVLIIGTFSVAGEKLLGVAENTQRRPLPRPVSAPSRTLPAQTIAQSRQAARMVGMSAPSFRPAPKVPPPPEPEYGPTEPTYQPLSLNASGRGQNSPTRQ